MYAGSQVPPSIHTLKSLLDLPPAAAQINRRLSRTLCPCQQLFSRFAKERSGVRRPRNGGNNSQDNPIITWKELVDFPFNNISLPRIFMYRIILQDRSARGPLDLSPQYSVSSRFLRWPCVSCDFISVRSYLFIRKTMICYGSVRNFNLNRDRNVSVGVLG